MAIRYTGDGNGFAIMAYCKRLIQQENLGDVSQYFTEATESDYNNLLDVSSRWTGVDFGAYYE